MRRRILMLGLATVMAIAGCSNAGGTTGNPTSNTAIPAGTAPVVSWSLSGGDLAAGQLALRPPRLVVYATGEVIADAAYRSDLPNADIASLIARLSEDLRGSDATKRRDGVLAAPNAPTTVLSVRSNRDTISASAAGLDELRQKDGYPATLYDARDRIEAIHERVVSSGQPYTADRILLVTETDLVDAPAPEPWPSSITLPVREGPGNVRIENLDGQYARDTVRLMARDLDLNGAWPA